MLWKTEIRNIIIIAEPEPTQTPVCECLSLNCFECAKLLMNNQRRFFSSLHSQNLTLHIHILPGDTQASGKFEYHHETKDHWHFYMHTNYYIVKPVNNSRWAGIGVWNMSIGRIWFIQNRLHKRNGWKKQPINIIYILLGCYSVKISITSCIFNVIYILYLHI